MTCGQCGKLLVERAVATKTKKIDGDVIVLAQRQALVCDEHGVVAWDPTHPVSYPVSYVPYVPAIPYRPWPMTVQPCSGTGGLSNPVTNVIQGNSARALSAVA